MHFQILYSPTLALAIILIWVESVLGNNILWPCSLMKTSDSELLGFTDRESRTGATPLSHAINPFLSLFLNDPTPTVASPDRAMTLTLQGAEPP